MVINHGGEAKMSFAPPLSYFNLSGINSIRCENVYGYYKTFKS